MASPVTFDHVEPAQSCGRQILTSRIKWPKKVWYAQGHFSRVFESSIRPFLDQLFQDIETSHADVFVRVYMIGRKPERAQPFVFVCCTNLAVLRDAEQCIRGSDLTRRFPAFRLGASAMPLEAHVPLRRIAAEKEAVGEDERSLRDARDTTIFSEVRIGASLFYAEPGEGASSIARSTGGPILTDGEAVYQLTARHLWDKSSYQEPPALKSSDLEYCYFDGQGEDDASDESDCDIMSMASASSAASSPSGIFTDDQALSLRSTPPAERVTAMSDQDKPQCNTSHAMSYLAYHKRTSTPDASSSDSVPRTTGVIELCHKMGTLPLDIVEPINKTPSYCDLDYTLLRIPGARPDLLTESNQLRDKGRSMTIGTAAKVPSCQTEVLALCASTGLVHGLLIPGAISHILHGRSTSIYQVQLKSAVVSGDSGAAVVDAATGDWYGQIVFGCPGTNQAYLVSALDIMRDININQTFERRLEVLGSCQEGFLEQIQTEVQQHCSAISEPGTKRQAPQRIKHSGPGSRAQGAGKDKRDALLPILRAIADTFPGAYDPNPRFGSQRKTSAILAKSSVLTDRVSVTSTSDFTGKFCHMFIDCMTASEAREVMYQSLGSKHFLARQKQQYRHQGYDSSLSVLRAYTCIQRSWDNSEKQWDRQWARGNDTGIIWIAGEPGMGEAIMHEYFVSSDSPNAISLFSVLLATFCETRSPTLLEQTGSWRGVRVCFLSWSVLESRTCDKSSIWTPRHDPVCSRSVGNIVSENAAISRAGHSQFRSVPWYRADELVSASYSMACSLPNQCHEGEQSYRDCGERSEPPHSGGNIGDSMATMLASLRNCSQRSCAEELRLIVELDDQDDDEEAASTN